MVSKFNKIKYHAINSQTPPTAFILLSAVLLKNLALTTIGVIGSLPLPNTLKYPNLVTSTTATLPSLEAFLTSSPTRDQSLSIFIVGQWN